MVCPIQFGGYARFHFLTATKKYGRKGDAVGRAAPSFCSLFFHMTDKFSEKYLWKSYEMHMEKSEAC